MARISLTDANRVHGGGWDSCAAVFAVLITFSILGGCETASTVVETPPWSVANSIPPDKITTEPRRFAAEGIRQLDQGDLDSALESFNNALRLEPSNSSLNFLAGATYHLLALRGNEAQFSLARQGYDRAIRADRSNWIAYYHFGLLELDQRRFKQAQSRFAETLIYNNSDPDLLYYTAVASYYSGDPTMAEGVLRRLREIEPGSVRVNQASALVLAALDDPIGAKTFEEMLARSKAPSANKRRVAKRLVEWSQFHTFNAAYLTAQNEKTDTPAEEAETGWKNFSPSTAAPGPKAAPVEKVTTEEEEEEAAEETEIDENQMIIVDVVIIRTEEKQSTSMGVNLLSGLTLEFGSASASTAGFSYSDTRTKTMDSITRTVTRALNLPAITYSLNIANSNNTRNEILARPTITAMNGEESEFFSGVSIKAATLPSTIGGTGESIQIEQDVGTKLKLTPEILADGRVKLTVTAERTFLNTPDTNIEGFTSRIETSRTTVTATVAMHFGETLILSGLSERETQREKDGVPFLQELPVIQYFFSRSTTSDFNKSVLLLLTPRLPEYVYRKTAAKGVKYGTRDENTSLTMLQARYADWFKPYPNWASVFFHLQDNSLYREFRTGDVTLERWESNISLQDRLKKILEFLYY